MVSEVILMQNPTDVPMVGISTGYSFECSVEVTCDEMDNATELTISFTSTAIPAVSSGSNPTMDVSQTDTYTSTLPLTSPVQLSYAGRYTCTAEISETPSSMSKPFNVKC